MKKTSKKKPTILKRDSQNRNFTFQLRVRYSETDQMSYVYYGKYAEYFEVARVEALRQKGFTYAKLEQQGVLFPVAEYQVKFFKPAFYDQLLTIYTQVEQLSDYRLSFNHETFVNDIQINSAQVVLACVNSKKKLSKVPQEIVDALIA